MSRHHKEREEKICLNCNAATYGRFCHVCGQENIETTETFWELLKHFVFDLFHFDGKFWVSVKYLLLKPGFLAKEYIRGRRASYLHPIRMYIFINTVFFIIFFSFYNESDSKNQFIKIKTPTAKEDIEKLEKYKASIERRLKDSLQQFRRDEFLNYLTLIDGDIELLKKDSTRVLSKLQSDIVDTSGFTINGKLQKGYINVEQYDSIQKKLSRKERDGFIKSYLIKIGLEYKSAAKQDRADEYKKQWFDKITHSIPKILFVSMPIFALILMILYARNKQYFYAHHIVFTLYFYCGLFILNLLNFWSVSIDKLLTNKEEGWFIQTTFTLAYMLYVYKSIRNFYSQSRLKTILKLILFGVLILLLIIIITLLAFLLIKYDI